MWAIDAAFVKAATDVFSQHGWAALFVQLLAALRGGGHRRAGHASPAGGFCCGPAFGLSARHLDRGPVGLHCAGVELFGERLRTSVPAITVSVIGLLIMAAGVVVISAWAPPVKTSAKRRSGAPPPPGGMTGGMTGVET